MFLVQIVFVHVYKGADNPSPGDKGKGNRSGKNCNPKGLRHKGGIDDVQGDRFMLNNHRV